ncbi:MAG TPA: polysaccharide biosynthesis/export family protein [Tepidisphaeraceae bacterium]|jgi:beta-lactamase regulating signal transducer with metallopeptidase domain/protocatechuate 3,4-dioxygenase beta subunit
MSGLLHAITHSPAVMHLGWPLLHFIWEGLAIALALRLVLAALRNVGPQARYWAACTAMGLLAVAPVLTYVLSDAPRPAETDTPAPLARTVPRTPRKADLEAIGANPMLAHRVMGQSVQTPLHATINADDSLHHGAMTASPPSVARRAAAALAPFAPWLVIAWAAGVLVLSARNLGAWIAVRQLRSLTTRAVGESLVHRAAALSDRLGLHRTVRLLQSTRVDSPLVIGVVKPVILLPASVLTELPAAQIEALLAHELAHVLRNDYLVNLFQCVIETLLFYHPAVWWVSHRLRIEREHCCDDLAVGVTHEREVYARALAALADAHITSLVPAGSGGVLMPRLRRILGLPDPDVGRSSFWLTGAIALAACLLVVVSISPNLTAHAAVANDKQPQHNERIGAGDLLDVTVADLQGPNVPMRKRVRVSTDGTVSLYYIKSVKLAGLTFDEAQHAVEKAYLDAYHLPQGAKTTIKRSESADRASVPLGPIRAGDEVDLTIFDLIGPNIASEHILRVEGNGEIALPYLATIQAAGLEEQAMERQIAKAYRDAQLIHDAAVAVLTVHDPDQANVGNGPIEAGDLLRITTSPEFNRFPPTEVTFNARVDADGRIGMPQAGPAKVVGIAVPRAGPVKVAGMTVARATIALGQALAGPGRPIRSEIWVLKQESGARPSIPLGPIRPGDRVEVTILGPAPDFPPAWQHVRQVAQDGTIPLPLLDKVSVAGLTETDAQQAIEKAYSAKYLSPDRVGVALLRLPPQSLPTTNHAGAATDQSNDVVHVHGRVLDPNGKPLAGAKVFAAPAWPRGEEAGRPAVVSNTTTDADGRFEVSFSKSAVSPLSLGYGQSGADLWKKVQITARTDGYGMDWQTFDHIDPATGDLVLRLVPDLPVKGRIVDLEGRPVPGVQVTVEGLSSHILTRESEFQHPPENYRAIGEPLAATGRAGAIVSDADGRFQIDGLGRDRVFALSFLSEKVALNMQRACTREGKITYDLNGSKDRLAHFEILGNTFELTAAPARTVVGVVRDAQTHKPLRNVRVFPSYTRIYGESVTDEQGRYRLAGLERDRSIEITAETTDEPYIPARIDLPEKSRSDPLTQDIELTRGVWITGKVVDAQTGAPILAEVNYEPLASNKIAATIPMFRLGWASPPCHAETAPDGTYRLVAPSGPGVVAVQLRDKTDYWRGQGFDAIKSKDRQGRAATMFPGMVNARVYHAAREIDAAPDAVTKGIDFQLQRADSVHVICTSADGKPGQKLIVMGHEAVLDGVGGEIIQAPRAEFDVRGLGPNETRLVVVRDDERHIGKVVKVRAADAPGGKLTIRLEPMGTVTGRLLNLQQEPIAGGRLSLNTAVRELRGANHSWVGNGHSGPDGRFKVEVPVGCPYILGASASPYGGEARYIEENPIDLAPGATKDMGDLQLYTKATMR